MDLRDDVIRAIEFSGPGRLPTLRHWYCRELFDRYGARLTALTERYQDNVGFAEFEGREAYFVGGRDEWGCDWEKSPDGVGAQVRTHPLPDWSRLDEFLPIALPRPERERRLAIARQGVAANAGKFVVGRLWRVFAERMAIWRGMENFLMDLHLQPAEIQRLCEFLTGFLCEMIDLFQEAGVDGIFLGDDWGTQTGLLIGPELWRRTFKPWYAQLCRAIHDRGLYVMFHSCGQITPLIEDFIEIGVDVLNPVQPNAMDPAELGARFGGRICFFGGIDTQRTLTEGTPAEVREEVRQRIESLGRFNGGYIGAPGTTVMPETPLENIAAMCQAFEDFG